MTLIYDQCQHALIHKKMTLKTTEKYRPISVPSGVYEIFTKASQNRIRETIDFQQPREHAGFRRRYSTMDRGHMINRVVEKRAVYNKPLYSFHRLRKRIRLDE